MENELFTKEQFKLLDMNLDSKVVNAEDNSEDYNL